jgi:UDP-N-acetylmuramyl pentapeptide phosphotransferase/UDP-N-acetylglucosamine-1-phosphate transferase
MTGGRRWPRFPEATNYRGVRVGLWLGPAVVGAVVAASTAVAGVAWARPGPGPGWAGRLLALALGSAGVCLAGIYDDARPTAHRGLRGHLGALAGGRVTPGVVKLTAILTASALLARALGATGPRAMLGTLVAAGSANLWNLLDVAPGRCLKWFLLAALPLALVVPDPGFRILAWASVAAGLLALPLDLGERAMLGDAGSNPLGLVVGVGLLLALPTWPLAVVLGVILALHALAETLTLSRAIAAVPPLRWLDRLGRSGSHPGPHRPVLERGDPL